MPDVVGKEVFELSEVPSVAARLLHVAGDCRVWLFEGDLGAGKTTVIKSLCHLLGVTATMGSPTFSIVNEYPTPHHGPVYHFDFYRLKNETEALDIGVDEYLDSGHYCFIEWPDRIENLIPKQHFKISLTHRSDTSRSLEYQIHD
ncbi:MAG: tRNA (adenosine(37)-N6)-threonylcarbamoyltransferase complex ATPase subunit type 1 TsaE [Bacteroidota bacterium]